MGSRTFHLTSPVLLINSGEEGPVGERSAKARSSSNN
jgi:hypothetical protein